MSKNPGLALIVGNRGIAGAVCALHTKVDCRPCSESTMPRAAPSLAPGHSLVAMARAATQAGEGLLADAAVKVRERVMLEGQVVGRLFDREQRATHGFAWLAT